MPLPKIKNKCDSPEIYVLSNTLEQFIKYQKYHRVLQVVNGIQEVIANRRTKFYTL